MCQFPIKGRTCKNPGEPYCWRHTPKEELPIKSTVPISKRDERKILAKIKRGPTLKDVEGFIYVYYLANDKTNTFYKIGRTARTVEERLKEWPGARFKWSKPVKHNEMAENLVHKLLGSIRVYRYKQEDGTYVTVSKETGFVIDGKGKQQGIKKEVEWFMAPWTTIEPVLDCVCGYMKNKFGL